MMQNCMFTVFSYSLRSIKSDYALMLVNLCGSLAIANLVFLVGIEQTDSRVRVLLLISNALQC